MQPYSYAIVGQQFFWQAQNDMISITAIPTGWLVVMADHEYDSLTPQNTIMIPDKDHHLNPRAIIPAGWQEILEDCTGHKTEHQDMANLLWDKGGQRSFEDTYKGKWASVESDVSGIPLLQSIYDALRQCNFSDVHIAGPRPSGDCRGFWVNPAKKGKSTGKKQFRIVILEDKN